MRHTLNFTALALTLAVVAQADDSPQKLMEQGHFKRARPLIEERYRANPNDAETLWMMSRIKQAFGDAKAAEGFAEKAVTANPKEARYHLQLADASGEVAMHANVLKQAGMARRIKKELDTTLSIDPKNVNGLKFLMEFYMMAPGIMGGDK